MPKDARHPSNPEEFAKILIEKLEKVKLERELNEREAHNLSTHLEVKYMYLSLFSPVISLKIGLIKLYGQKEAHLCRRLIKYKLSFIFNFI